MSGPDIVTDADGQTIYEYDQTICRIAFDIRTVSPSNAVLAFNNLQLSSHLYLQQTAIDFRVEDCFDGNMALMFVPQCQVRDESEHLNGWIQVHRPSLAHLLSLINRTDVAAAIPPTLLHSIRIDQMECKANVSSSGASGDESYKLELLTLSASVGNTPRQQISYYDGPSTPAPRNQFFFPSVPFSSAESGRISVMKVVQSRLIQSCLIPDVVAAIEGRILEPHCYLSVVQASMQLDEQFVRNFNQAFTQLNPELIPLAIVNSAPQPIHSEPFVSVVAVSTHLTLLIPLSAQTRVLPFNPLMSAEESSLVSTSAYQLILMRCYDCTINTVLRGFSSASLLTQIVSSTDFAVSTVDCVIKRHWRTTVGGSGNLSCAIRISTSPHSTIAT